MALEQAVIPDLDDDQAAKSRQKNNGRSSKLKDENDTFPKNNGQQPNVSLSPVLSNKNFEPFPVDVLPEPLKGFVKESSKSLGVGSSMLATPLFAILASCVGATRTIKLKRDWTEPSVLWTAILGSPGSLKSPALKIVIELLDDIQNQAFFEYETEREGYESRFKDYKIDFSEWKKTGRKSSKSKLEKPDEPLCKRYLCRDITVEAIAPILKSNSRGLLVCNDELAVWLSFDRYTKNAKGSNLPHWLSMFRALPITKDRATGQEVIHIPRATVSITGGLQPSVLRKVLQGDSAGRGEIPANEMQHINDGLLSRILLTFPPQKIKKWNESSVAEKTTENL